MVGHKVYRGLQLMPSHDWRKECETKQVKVSDSRACCGDLCIQVVGKEHGDMSQSISDRALYSAVGIKLVIVE